MGMVKALLIAGVIAAAACSGGVYVQRTPAGAPASAAETGSPALVPAAAATVWVTLSDSQAAAVRAHYAPQNGNSRGRGRGSGLPPGIARNLDRGKALPPGIARQYLPQELVLRLPRLEDGLDYVVAAGKLLLVETATQIVRQVLIDALYT